MHWAADTEAGSIQLSYLPGCLTALAPRARACPPRSAARPPACPGIAARAEDPGSLHSYYTFSPRPGGRVIALDGYQVSVLGWPPGHPQHEAAAKVCGWQGLKFQGLPGHVHGKKPIQRGSLLGIARACLTL